MTVVSLVAAVIFTIIMVLAIVFYISLVFGAPYSEYCMGGRFSGRLSTQSRLICLLLQVPLLVLMALVVLARADVAFPTFYSSWLIWVVVTIMGFSLLMNVIMASSWDRYIWAPQVIACFVCSLCVALDA
ncbi:hypothetical protein AaE_010265 [Aphanomyces astaci]|uniref:Uncharacterized protein n=1 Tax=Aphanomyces astaci TaxID=112090 RepID=A0A6A5A5D4_APHAT|nr:hypothetical protein AaE_010265 [Aphanomyces astaci]